MSKFINEKIILAVSQKVNLPKIYGNHYCIYFYQLAVKFVFFISDEIARQELSLNFIEFDTVKSVSGNQNPLS